MELEVSHTYGDEEEEDLGDRVAQLQVGERGDDEMRGGTFDDLFPEQVRLLQTDHTERELCKLLFSKSRLEWLWSTALKLPIKLVNWARIELVRLFLVALPVNQMVMRGCLRNCR